ncbi:MAG: flagellar biosynthesis protein FlhF [Leptospiraceae bacterium]|nr:flagellar biosynthesis protein FlhF [Leptospiraceae bacterium]MCP5497511.1 flagellar biosynthesis protein FlhF [Leptospiraceae bacterium]
MDFVKIRGKDIQDCFMQMKMKYGPEAHVYDQRVITEGGLFGTNFLAKKTYEIEVGIPEQQSSKDRVEKKLKDLKDLLRQKSEDEGKKKVNDIKPLLNKEENSESLRNLEALPKETTNESKNESNLQSVHDEKARVSKQKSSINYDSVYIKRLKEKLEEEGMSSSYTEELSAKLDKHLSFIEKSKSSSVYEKAAELIEERISVDSDLFSGSGRGKRKVVFFVGPTGSGKTTTIAKLAAKYFLHNGRLVSLYTTDNYRIAAIEQLKRYADTMDIPFYAVKDANKFREALYRDGAELILIDTAGYSHKNNDFVTKMKNYRESFGERDQIENILVMSATSSYSNMKSVITAYEGIGYQRIILTKIDEADFVGNSLELADRYSKEFAYFSIGQEVPFDIIPAEKKLLAEITIYPEKIKDIRGEIFSIKTN